MFGVQPSPAVNSVSPRHAHEAVSRGALLVDVRDDAEKLALSPFAAVSVCDEQAALVALLATVFPRFLLPLLLTAATAPMGSLSLLAPGSRRSAQRVISR